MNILKKYVYILVSKYISLYLKTKVNYIYYIDNGFGETLFFYFLIKLNKIKNKNKKIFCYTALQYQIAKFLFSKKKNL